MSHHESEMSPEQRRHFEKFFQETKSNLGLGATGQFPQGQIHSRDEGEIKLAIGYKNGKVFLAFGTTVEWIGFDKAQALALAATLTDHANQL